MDDIYIGLAPETLEYHQTNCECCGRQISVLETEDPIEDEDYPEPYYLCTVCGNLSRHPADAENIRQHYFLGHHTPKEQMWAIRPQDTVARDEYEALLAKTRVTITCCECGDEFHGQPPDYPMCAACVSLNLPY